MDTHAVVERSNGDTYAYDANGNMIQRHVGSQTYDLAYDAENRLATVYNGQTLVASFVYDGDGRRVKSAIGTATTYFGGNIYEKVVDSVAGTTETKYYYAGGSRVAMRQGANLYYLLSDHLGSTTVTTDASGAIVSELKYKPWGEVRYTSGTTPTDYTFTGQYSNTSDFGLMYYNARWYDAGLGRMASADTFVPRGFQGLDRYAYANNSPVNFTDPSGHEPNWKLRHLKRDYGRYWDDVKGAWNREGARALTGYAENLAQMLVLAYMGYDSITLVGSAIDMIQSDSAFVRFRARFLFDLFSGGMDAPYEDAKHLGFGGVRSPTSMFMQLADSGNPRYAATRAVGRNQLSWMLRNALVSVRAEVSAKGQVTLSYELHDVFDLKPEKQRSLAYNTATYVLGSVWHGALDASSPEVHAYWTETLELNVDVSIFTPEG